MEAAPVILCCSALLVHFAPRALTFTIPDTDDVADIALADMPNGAWDQVIHNNGTLQDLYSLMESTARILCNDGQ